MLRMASERVKPMRVDRIENPWDRIIMDMAERGMAPRFIHAKVPELTMSQVMYRVTKAGGVKAYRNGRGRRALELMRRVDKLLVECRTLLERRTVKVTVKGVRVPRRKAG
jgi:hypothetical protein